MRDFGVRSDLSTNRDAITELCQKFGVRTLTVYGPAIAGEGSGASGPVGGEVNFLVDIDPLDDMCHMGSFVGLKASLEDLLGLPVQLLGPVALQDPRVVQAILHTGLDLYPAWIAHHVR